MDQAGGSDFAFRGTNSACMPALSGLRRMPLSAYSGGGAGADEERDFARDAFEVGGRAMERGDSGTLRGTLRVPQPGTVGGAERNAPGSRVFFAGKFGDSADRHLSNTIAAIAEDVHPVARDGPRREIAAGDPRDRGVYRFVGRENC